MNIRIRFVNTDDSTGLMRFCPLAPNTAFKNKIGSGKVKNSEEKTIGYYDLFED